MGYRHRMSGWFQALGIAAASAAMFAGVYALAPGKGSDASPAGAIPAGAKSDEGGPVANPLEPAERGLIECTKPNEGRKTCRAMAVYKPLGGGRYRDTTVMLVANEGPALLEIEQAATVRDGTVCWRPTSATFTRGKLIVAGRRIDSRRAAPVLAAASKSVAGILNKELCSRYSSSFGDLTAKAFIDGVPRPELDSRIKWVGPDDGYTVAP